MTLSTPEVTALVGAITSYATTYHANDLDALSASGGALRAHAGYAWLAGQGLAEQFDARILAQIENFGVTKIRQILAASSPKWGGNPDFQVKVNKAVTTNRFWSPNDGFFFEIGDLQTIRDVSAVEVPVGGRVIDSLTKSGELIDQKYIVGLQKPARGRAPGPPALDPRLVAQCNAMQAAVGTTISSILVTDWSIRYAQPMSQQVQALVAAAGWTRHFRPGTSARTYL